MKLKTILSIPGLILIIVIFFLVNFLSASLFQNTIIDLTEEKLFSLSKGTKQILGSLESPLTLKYYYSATEMVSVPFLKSYAERISDLLKEYKRDSKGNINLEIYDPRPDTEEEEWAGNYGLQAAPLPNGRAVYLGLVVSNGSGDEKVIPFIDQSREEFLEYDITKLIYDISKPAKKKIGVISTLKVFGSDIPPMNNPYFPRQRFESEPWLFIKELKKSFLVDDLGTSVVQIPEDIDMLLVIHPKGLNDKVQYAIDQYVMNGKRAIFFVDPFSQIESEAQRQGNNPYASFGGNFGSGLNRLFNVWGIDIPNKDVVGDINIPTKVNTGSGSPVDYLVFLSLTDKYINKNDVITGKLESILLPCAGKIVNLKKQGIEVVPLLHTSKEAAIIDNVKVSFSHPQMLLDDFKKGSEEITLGAKLSGVFVSAFPSGQPEVKPDDTQDNKTPESYRDTHRSQCQNKNTIIVVADTDLIHDQFFARVQNLFGFNIVNMFNDNLHFFLNAIENLVGSEALISIRSRGKFSRPFIKVKEIENKAAERWQEKEKELQKKVDETNKKLRELQQPQKGESSRQLLTQAISNEIEKFRQERKESQKELRTVRKKLREDKEWWGTILFMLNSFLIPLVILLALLAMMLVKMKKE